MIKKALNTAYMVFIIIVFAWCLLSYGEILYKNLRPDPQYSAYNALVLLTNIK